MEVNMLNILKDTFAVLNYMLIFLVYPIWKFFRGLNKNIEKLNTSLDRLNNTVRFLETIVLDIADDKTIAKATKKLKAIKGEDKNGASDNFWHFASCRYCSR